MNIIELKDKQAISGDSKLSSIYSQFGKLLGELKNKDLPQNIIGSVNDHVESINASSLTGNELRKLVKQKQTAILKQVEKEGKIVPQNHYRNLWMLLGMTGFGLPIGMGIGLSIGNMGLLGLGLPIGMAIGLAIGSAMDKKALNEGRQLNITIKH
jgi:hypothetical protein